MDGRILAFTLAALMPSPEFSLKSHKLADARWTFASMPLFVLSFERTGGSKSESGREWCYVEPQVELSLFLARP